MAALSVSAALGAAKSTAQPGVFAITGVTIVDVAASNAADARKRNQTVVVTGDRITEVGATGGTRVPPGTLRVDGSLIPGLWDMHVHLMNTEERIEYMGAALPARTGRCARRRQAWHRARRATDIARW